MSRSRIETRYIASVRLSHPACPCDWGNAVEVASYRHGVKIQFLNRTRRFCFKSFTDVSYPTHHAQSGFSRNQTVLADPACTTVFGNSQSREGEVIAKHKIPMRG
ncbi:hypothetical protein HC931_26905 [Candidatus Gracilibacteria bacterium]|nr:hypothetical protein [Candidatus Gracilibacteria bacterium]NJP22219.1 hypothetical protein [Hydrococcus sp. CRU_1_1]